jgi:hypothetical protein
MSITAPATNPNVARDFQSLRTPEQLNAIRLLANLRRVCPWDECERVMGVMPEDLSIKSADVFIKYLDSLGRI